MPKAVLKKNATVFTNKLNINLRKVYRNAAAQLRNFGRHRNYLKGLKRGAGEA
jgi:hypothetical protein